MKLRTPSVVFVTFLLTVVFASVVQAKAPSQAQREFSKMIHALAGNDYDQFIADGDAAFKTALTKASFSDVVSQVAPRLKKGYEATYLGKLKQHGLMVCLWKIDFDEGDDVLVRVIMKYDRKANIVSGFFLQ
jgi:hypothetical protein